MKKIIILLVLLFSISAQAQNKYPKEYINPDGKISLSRSTPFFQALEILNEISSRLEKIVLIDEKNRTERINVDVIDLPWREALKLILKVNNLNMQEYPNYIKIVETGTSFTGGPPDSNQPEQDYHSEMREVSISAVFFEADRTALKEKGINWDAIIEHSKNTFSVSQNVTSIASENDLFTVDGTIREFDNDINVLLKALESEEVGEIIANPNILVVENEKGRVQVGQDFSVKQLDIAGNVTDNFISSGIILEVTPTVVKEDSFCFIHLKVNAERSSAFPNAVSTIINKTNTQTSLFLLDGEKAVIAGLYSTNQTKQRRGIPVLKDLPWWFFGVRYLTGYDREELVEKELVIVLQAHMLPQLKNRDIDKNLEMDFLKMKKRELRNRWKNRQK